MAESRLLHTGDVHLGRSNPSFGGQAALHRERIAAAFARSVDLALERRVHLFLVAGDLFDRQRPGGQAVRRALAQLARLGEASPPVRAVILPGTRTHDAWGSNSVWRLPDLRQLPPHVHILTPDQPRLELPDLGVLVQGRPASGGGSAPDPLVGLVADRSFAFNVGLCHASVERGDIGPDNEAAIVSRAAMDATGFDYLALGHWHGASSASEGASVPAWYCGAPELLSFDQPGPGQVLAVTLTQGSRPVIEPGITGSLRSDTLSIDLAEMGSAGKAATAIAAHADRDLMLRVRLTGLAPPGLAIDSSELQGELAGEFFLLDIVDESHLALDQAEGDDFPEQLVIGRFLRLARERVEATRASGDERALRIAERALRTGLVALQTGEVP